MNICTVDNCGKVLSTRYKLKLHIKRHHLNIKLYPCVNCLKSFKSSDSLKRHQYRHKEVQVVDAPLTGTRGTTKCTITIPQLTHMLKFTKDIDLMQNVHVEYLYLFLTDMRKVILPAISH